jgi:hypothetical protein
LCYILTVEKPFTGCFGQISGKNTFLSPSPHHCLREFLLSSGSCLELHQRPPL